MKKDEINDFIRENYEKMDYTTIAKHLGMQSDAVRKRARRMKLPHKKINSQVLKLGTTTNKDVITVLQKKGLTESQIEKIFKMKYDDVKKLASKISDYDLYEQINDFGEKVIVLLKKIEESNKILPKKWTFAKQIDGQPYLWIKLPQHKNDKQLRIVLLSDVHYGHTACNINNFVDDIEYIKNNDNAYAILTGDLIENASKLSIAGGVYEQNSIPNEQIQEIVELLKPIAHKILWYNSGNHEQRTMDHMGIDVGEFIAHELKIPYYNEPVYVDLMWNNNRWTIFSQHGSTSSLTKGGKINAASKPINWLEFCNFVIMGHVHDKMTNEVTRICRDTINFRLVEKRQYVIVAGSYLRYFNTYGSRKGYAPPTKGRVALKLYSHGDYRISE